MRRPALACVVLIGCGSHAAEPVSPAPVPADAAPAADATTTVEVLVDGSPPAALVVPPDLAITLARTACFGSCAIYTVTVNAAGDVFFAASYPKPGCATRTIAASDVAALARRVDAIHFFALEDEYTDDISDYPSANTTVVSGGRTKHVHHYLADPLAAPDLADRTALRDLEHAIDELTGVPLAPLGACHGKSPYPGAP